MMNTLATVRRKIEVVGELKSIVRTLKAMAASSINQYETAVTSLSDYFRTVRLGLHAYIRENEIPAVTQPDGRQPRAVILFGSDLGLVGQFNEAVVEFGLDTLKNFSGKYNVWAVGDRVRSLLVEAGVAPSESFSVPHSVNGIAALVGQLLTTSQHYQDDRRLSALYTIHNRPNAGNRYEPTLHQLLPLDSKWQSDVKQVNWPTKNPPQVIGEPATVLLAIIREYLFVSLTKACAESLASENASRLMAMQRAEKNIEELVQTLNQEFHHMRQSGIDEELFDLISGFEALRQKKTL